jgi:hypothetical protein
MRAGIGYQWRPEERRRKFINRIFITLVTAAAGLFLALPASAFHGLAKPSAQADKPTSPGAKAYETAADAAVALLVKGDVAGFKKRLSPKMIERLGEAPMEASLKNQILPFFADYERAGKTIAITETQDIFGHTGFAVYKSFLAKEGNEKPFIVYVVSEKNRLVVANLLVNKTYQDMNQGRLPK